MKQLAPKDLKELEDVTDDSLPQVTGNHVVSGGAKFSQLGPPAAEEIFKRLLAGAELDKLPAVFILDLNPRVGDFALAFSKLRCQLNIATSLFFVGVPEKNKDIEWLRLTLIEELVDKVKAGNLVLPGMQPFQAEVSNDLLEALPALPVMNLLITEGEGEFRQLKIPRSLIQKWRTDEDFGEEFGRWLDPFLEVYSAASEEPVPGENQSKRPAAGQPEEQQASPKKAKTEEVSAEFIMSKDKIMETLLFDCKLTSKDSLNYQVRTGQNIYLVNLTEQEQTLKALTPLIGFGRGQFKLCKAEETTPEKAIIFEISDAEQLICLNGTVATISDCLFQQRKKNPEIGVAYHKVGLVPEQPGKFKFMVTHMQLRRMLPKLLLELRGRILLASLNLPYRAATLDPKKIAIHLSNIPLLQGDLVGPLDCQGAPTCETDGAPYQTLGPCPRPGMPCCEWICFLVGIFCASSASLKGDWEGFVRNRLGSAFFLRESTH